MKEINKRALMIVFCLVFITITCLVSAKTLDPKDSRPDPDGTTLWYDCERLKIEGKGWTETESFYDRLPAKAKETVPKNVWALSHDTAGMSVHFSTDATSIKVMWDLLSDSTALPHMPATGVSGIDLYARDKSGKWQFIQNGRPIAVRNIVSFGLSGAEEYMLYLPLYNGISLINIAIDKDKSLSHPDEPGSGRRKAIVFYGTSITQGGCASRPGMAAVSIVGRRLDVPIINLGFSGNGKMEIALAELLGELDASVYVVDCLWNMSHNEINERFEPFVKKLRQLRPATPIVLPEDSHFRNQTPTAKGEIARGLFAKLKEQGIEKIYFLPNESMLGNDGEGTVDSVHPTDLGMMRQAEVFIKALRPILQASNK